MTRAVPGFRRWAKMRVWRAEDAEPQLEQLVSHLAARIETHLQAP